MKRSALYLLPLILCLSLTGCGPDFYLTEYETAALNSQIIDQNNAQLFAQTLVADPNNLAGTRLAIQFDMVNGRPQVRSSNLAQQLRRVFSAQENLSEGQLNIDRMSGEFERQLNTLLADRLQVYANTSGAEVTLERLDEMIILLRPTPAVAYQPARQLITLDATLQFSLRGTVRVQLNGFLGFLAGIFGSSTMRYPMSINVNNYRLHAEARLLVAGDAAQLSLRFRPVVAAADITVTGDGVTLPAQMTNEVRPLLTAKLNAPLDDVRGQRYQNFMLSAVTLKTSPAQLQIAYRALPETARPVVHAVSRAADGKLYHARRAADVWSTWAATPFPNLVARVDNDPVLVANGAEQLELAAVAADGKLVYAHWRDGAWGSQATLGTPFFLTLPGQQSPPTDFQGKPALVATAPGQVEIIVAGRDGQLWHLRRLNGVWQNAALISVTSGAAPFRDPVAVQAGNKIAVFCADANNQLRMLTFNLETNTWNGNALAAPEPIRYAPAAVASGNGRVDVVCVGASGTPFHRIVTLLPVSNTVLVDTEQTQLDGNLSATPELVASGFEQLDLIGRGTDNRLYHRHYVGFYNRTGAVDGRTVARGWTAWDGLSRFYLGHKNSTNFQSFNGQMSDAALASTVTGQAELLARTASGNPQNALFQSTYDSAKYGRDLWKTIGWRGLQKVAGPTTLSGRPALAACDQHSELAFAGNNGGNINARYGRVTEGRVARFTLNTNAPVTNFPNPLDPVILAHGPGLTDMLYLGADGAPRHVRRRNDQPAQTYTLARPSGVTLRSALAAVSYGNGAVELVMVGSDNGLYHWRHRGGNWETPMRLNGAVISAPVLASVGAGNLELLALGGDLKLYRWRFVNGQWANWQQLASSFTLDATKFGPQMASSYGDGTLDVAVVSAQTGAIYQRRIGGYENLPAGGLLAPPVRGFNLIGGNVADTPALLAVGPVHLHLLARGTDGVTYSNTAFANGNAPLGGGDRPLGWRGYAPISQPGLLMGGIVAAGPREFSALAVDTAGRLWLNRYDGMSWRGFLPLAGQTPEMQLGPPLFRPALAGHY